MVRLKLNRIKKVICSTCGGNGYIKAKEFDGEDNINQCFACDSEGEVYETVSSKKFIGHANSSRSIN
jgi:DnaJ-class molecular chaperone